MLHLYRRHLKSCPHRAWTYRRCQCPILVKGTLAGEFVKKSLDMTNWDAAQKLIGEWVKDGKIGQLVPAGSTTIQTAVVDFLKDAEVRGLSKATIGKYKVLLEGRLLKWARGEEATALLWNLNLDALTRFRATWPDAPLAKQKNQERLRAFLRWCVARSWLSSNPADGLSTVKVRPNPTLPFSQDEMSAIIDACSRYPTANAYGYDNRSRVLAFVLTLRYSGLRIRDVVTLRWDAVQDGKIDLYTQKTGQHVYVPLPASCVASLETIRGEGEYVFWTGRGLAKSAVADWQRSLRKLFELAKVEGGHAHRFRDTFAVELLLAGVDIADVSILLGHSSIKITERHYSPWVAARQRRIEEIVQRVHSSSTTPSTGQTGSDPAPTARRPAGGPAPQPIEVSASSDRASRRQLRTGTADEPSRPIHPRILQFASGRDGVQ